MNFITHKAGIKVCFVKKKQLEIKQTLCLNVSCSLLTHKLIFKLHNPCVDVCTVLLVVFCSKSIKQFKFLVLFHFVSVLCIVTHGDTLSQESSSSNLTSSQLQQMLNQHSKQCSSTQLSFIMYSPSYGGGGVAVYSRYPPSSQYYGSSYSYRWEFQLRE